jgi:hypothetical protein
MGPFASRENFNALSVLMKHRKGRKVHPQKRRRGETGHGSSGGLKRGEKCKRLHFSLDKSILWVDYKMKDVRFAPEGNY